MISDISLLHFHISLFFFTNVKKVKITLFFIAISVSLSIFLKYFSIFESKSEIVIPSKHIFSENIINSKLSIFPNPSNGSTTIVLENLADLNVDVSLINILGSEVSKLYAGEIVSKYQEISADLSNLEKGIYFVKIVNNGDVIMTDKLIIK